MRIISTYIHGILDYIVGVLLIVAPWVMNFAAGGAETWVPIIIGAGIIVYSLLTNYELGAIRVIGKPMHLTFDVIGGAVLAASPWLFGFSDRVYMPHLIVGIFEIVAALMTRTMSLPARTASTPGHAGAH